MKKCKIALVGALSLSLLACAAYGQNTVAQGSDINYEGYTEKFRDDFNGKKLNTKVWNYETHEPGWVNNELQEYVVNKKNVYLKDGKLVIQAIENVDKRGNRTYTSGRINTMGKRDYKYGIFEARLKVPKGQGFLPAFWMMPTNEQLYGQWPVCGEIDIMEVLGNKIDTSYSTIHFGEPHAEKQVSTKLASGNFSDEFHTFTLEWVPDEIRYYVDGHFIGKINEWYTQKGSDDPLTFPAPFDQPYYMIFNVAVGGNWPGNPDETTKFNADAQMVVDWVRVLQKDSYNEDVRMKEVVSSLRAPYAGGNYVSSKDSEWTFLEALGGVGKANISNGSMTIETSDAGTVDYSIQLVQPNIPMEKTGLYKFEFDAYASEPRTMSTGITAPDNGYIRYFGDQKVELGTSKKHYSFDFMMTKNSDPNGRVEFNMGATSSTATIYISNVSVKKLGNGVIPEAEKTFTQDGNYVYNGSFDKGDGRLKYWTVSSTGPNKISVTNINNVRECKIEVTQAGEDAAVLSQGKMPLDADSDYILSFSSPTKDVAKAKFYVNGNEVNITAPSGNETLYKGKFSTAGAGAVSELRIVLSEKGTVLIDNVRIAESGLLVNKGFEKGLAGWQLYTYSGSEATVDTSAKNAAITITDTTEDEWKIQLKQTDVVLKKGQKYRFSFDVTSTVGREIKYAFQRDGARWLAEHGVEDWMGYNEAPTCKVGPNKQTVVQEFTMWQDDDPHTIMTFSFGKVNGKRIKDVHTVTIDNVLFEAID